MKIDGHNDVIIKPASTEIDRHWNWALKEAEKPLNGKQYHQNKHEIKFYLNNDLRNKKCSSLNLLGIVQHAFCKRKIV